MFCKKCGKLMSYEEGRLICSCGYSEEGELIIKDRKRSVDKKIGVVKEENDIHPVVDKTCIKCKNDKAYTWALQTRSADEPETIFYKCVKCKHSWRE